VGVKGEGTGDAVCDWAMEDEVQRAEVRQRVALDGAFLNWISMDWAFLAGALKEFGKMRGDALGGDFLFEQREVVFAEGD